MHGKQCVLRAAMVTLIACRSECDPHAMQLGWASACQLPSEQADEAPEQGPAPGVNSRPEAQPHAGEDFGGAASASSHTLHGAARVGPDIKFRLCRLSVIPCLLQLVSPRQPPPRSPRTGAQTASRRTCSSSTPAWWFACVCIKRTAKGSWRWVGGMMRVHTHGILVAMAELWSELHQSPSRPVYPFTTEHPSEPH